MSNFMTLFFMKLRGKVREGSTTAFIVRDDETLVMGTKFCIHSDDGPKREILDEA